MTHSQEEATVQKLQLQLDELRAKRQKFEAMSSKMLAFEGCLVQAMDHVHLSISVCVAKKCMYAYCLYKAVTLACTRQLCACLHKAIRRRYNACLRAYVFLGSRCVFVITAGLSIHPGLIFAVSAGSSCPGISTPGKRGAKNESEGGLKLSRPRRQNSGVTQNKLEAQTLTDLSVASCSPFGLKSKFAVSRSTATVKKPKKGHHVCKSCAPPIASQRRCFGNG